MIIIHYTNTQWNLWGDPILRLRWENKDKIENKRKRERFKSDKYTFIDKE